MRSLAGPNPAFAGDRGEADPRIRAAIAGAFPVTRDAYLRAVVALCTARLLMPLVTAGDEDERTAELSAVSIQAADGRRALLGFTGLDSLQAWEPAARPVPCTLDDLAATVPEAGADALLIDVAGPVPFVIEADLIAELGRGRRLVQTQDGGFGWAYMDA